jgi:Ca2+-binding EF-hand superfamily protein
MKLFKLVALVGLAAVFIFAGVAFAQGPGGHGGPGMSCQDRFDSMDTNHDGKLSLEEFTAAPHHHRGNPEEMFKAMDVNGHGYVTKDEFCSAMAKHRHGMGQGTGADR